MRRLILLALLMTIAGCTKAQRIDRSTLDQRYQETQLAEGVLSVVPLRLAMDEPSPTVVNWWYAGTSGGQHHLVYRELTWDDAGQPRGREVRYRIARGELVITEPIEKTSDERRWLALYEVATGAIKPPADLPTARQAPKPVTSDPIALPEELVLPREED